MTERQYLYGVEDESAKDEKTTIIRFRCSIISAVGGKSEEESQCNSERVFDMRSMLSGVVRIDKARALMTIIREGWEFRTGTPGISKFICPECVKLINSHLSHF